MDSQVDLEELNKQMLFFQNDFKINPQQAQNQQYENDISTINFQPPPDSPIQTTQIKKPVKSSGHRNDINDKLNNINMEMPMIRGDNRDGSNGNIPNMMPQYSRNNSNYMEVEQSSTNQTANLFHSKSKNSSGNSSGNPSGNQFAQYYNNNYSTLQDDNQQHPRIQKDDISNIIMQQNKFNNTNSNPNTNTNTHTDGITFVNARNIYETNAFNQNNQSNSMPVNNIKINDMGFHKIDEKRIDYRQNINNKIDNFIFENPNATPFNPILQQHTTSFQRDTRMVIQDSSKDYYRQESNSRMSQYSPLSRASNVPINIANMSVNDFYANMLEPNNSANQIITTPTQDNNKAILNSRMGQYAPLARNIQYQIQPQQTPIQQQQNIVFGQNQLPTQLPKQNPYTKPNVWNPNEVNLKTNNVYFNQLPVMSNK